MGLTVRFSEIERYDINLDRQVVMFMAITPKGSFYAEVPFDEYKDLREKRSHFKEAAIECMQEGAEPGEIDLA